MENQEIILNLYGKGRRFSKAERATIRKMCEEAGLGVNFATNCPNCYADAVLLLALHYHVALGADLVTASGNYVYHRGHRVTQWTAGGITHHLDATSGDKVIERYMAAHPTQTAFSTNRKETENDTQ